MAARSVTIDTSVFMHLFNTDKNADAHIDKLLSELATREYRLCVDDQGRIMGEYKVHLVPIISKASDVDDRRRLPQYWIAANPQMPACSVKHNDNLMAALKGIIVEQSETADRVFVYVAISSNSPMISNDMHIVGNDKNIPDRRNALTKLAKKQKANAVEFHRSSEAAATLASWGQA